MAAGVERATEWGLDIGSVRSGGLRRGTTAHTTLFNVSGRNMVVGRPLARTGMVWCAGDIAVRRGTQISCWYRLASRLSFVLSSLILNSEISSSLFQNSCL
ncbi:AraC family transcriptional regulator [Sesbania bispinosa]|nr:AraC family transcriptional regulator [Sesbania bispinosa]